jgi:nicotinamide riboside kinase
MILDLNHQSGLVYGRAARGVADTTALMTAIYSQLLFDDASLVAPAVQAHASVSISLVTAPDLPWVADGHQRDGPHMRAPVDALLRTLLQAHALPWAPVQGSGPARLASALHALQPLLPRPGRPQFTSEEPGG